MKGPFDGLRPAPPDVGLRERVLAAARAAEASPPHWIDLVWESRRFRLALASALVLAVVANAVFTAPSTPRSKGETLVEIEGFQIPSDRMESSRITYAAALRSMTEATP